MAAKKKATKKRAAPKKRVTKKKATKKKANKKRTASKKRVTQNRAKRQVTRLLRTGPATTKPISIRQCLQCGEFLQLQGNFGKYKVRDQSKWRSVCMTCLGTNKKNPTSTGKRKQSRKKVIRDGIDRRLRLRDIEVYRSSRKTTKKKTSSDNKPRLKKKAIGQLLTLPARIENRLLSLEDNLDQLVKVVAMAKDEINEMKRVLQRENEKPEGRSVDIVDLHFEVLPPGQWRPANIIQYYQRLARVHPTKYRERKIQKDRIREIWKLKPQTAYRGKLKWLGYVVYDFSYTDNVVLECALEGNAVYILQGSRWKSLIKFSKGEIRDNHKGLYKKVVHKQVWLPRVQAALHDL